MARPIVFASILLIFTGCSSKPAPLPKSPGDYLWVANSSPINFDGLIEIQQRDVDLGRGLYEGFFERYEPSRGGTLSLNWGEDCDELFSPEAEWVLHFPNPAQLDGPVEDAIVEVRGMIEGKWLHVLERRQAKDWHGASAANNVIAEPIPDIDPAGLRMTIRQLDQRVANRTFNPSVVVREVASGDAQPSGPIFHAAFADTYPFLDSYGDVARRKNGTGPIALLVSDVYRAFRQHAPRDARLVAINLSAHGAYAALVNDPVLKAEIARQNALLRTLAKPFGQTARVQGMVRLVKQARREGPPRVATAGSTVRYEVLVYADASDGESKPAVLRGTLNLAP